MEFRIRKKQPRLNRRPVDRPLIIIIIIIRGFLYKILLYIFNFLFTLEDTLLMTILAGPPIHLVVFFTEPRLMVHVVFGSVSPKCG
jgi:hypothetical protein